MTYKRIYKTDAYGHERVVEYEFPNTAYFKECFKWPNRYFRMLEEIKSWSKDPKTKVGALLVSPDRSLLVPGYNGFPKGIADDHRLLDENLKNKIVRHAEQNAIGNIKQYINGFTMYSTRFPCTKCAGDIIQFGIEKVFTYPIKEGEARVVDKKLSLELLLEAGIALFVKVV